MVAVKTGLAPPPMMPNQPMNMMPPPMPVPALNQPMPMQQGAAPVPVNARRRKRFGDSLETMLSRPPMVASDQMGDMNVFTGQMMNTAARPPVVGMRGGGIVRNMRRGGYSMADYSSPSFTSYTDSKKNTFAPTAGTPGRAVKTHDEIMASIRGTSSPGDDKPAPVVVVPPPASDPLDAFGGSGPDISADPNYVSDGVGFKYDPIVSGGTGTSGLPPIPLNEIVVTAPSEPSAPVGSGMNPSNVYVDPLDPFGGPGPDVSNTVGALPGMSFGQQPAGALPMDPDFYDPRDDRSGFVDPLEPFGGAGEIINLGIGDPEIVRPKVRPEGGGQGGTGSGEEDDRGFVEKFKDDVKNFGSSLIKDLQMAADAGFFGGYGAMEKRLREARNPDGSLKYTPDEVTDYIRRTKETQADQLKKQAQQSAQDDDSPMSTSVVDPCPPGFKLDPVSGICVPIEEAEEEGPSLSLNRTRDDEFNELDDIMKKIVKPVGEDVKTMQAGGSVGLNRVADNFLAAMGG